jgi:magnesium transporter
MTTSVYNVSQRALVHASVSEVAAGTEDTTVWIDLFNPRRDEIIELGQRFGFHELAVEDALKRRQRPKADFYTDHAFVVLYALEPDPDSAEVRSHEISMFAGKGVVVTIHTEEVPEIEVAAHRWGEHCASRSQQTSAMLVYTLVDSIVDGYFPCMDRIAEEIDALETSMFDDTDTHTLQQIFRLKRALLDLRRVVAPARDVFNAFTRWELPALGEDSVYYFQDVYDHVIRVTDQIDAQRDVLASAIDVHLSLVSNRMNQTVRTLTAASIVLMSLALIAGIYGMNLHLTPSPNESFGFWFALGLMAVIGGGLALLFRKLEWW